MLTRTLTAWARLLILGFLGGTGLGAQPGYQLLPERVLVDQPSHWEAWEAAEGVRIIRDDGSVEPRFVQRHRNAVLNAGEFAYVDEGDTLVGGIRGVGSNHEAGPLAMDGELGTFWEPEGENLENWFLEIDLGRAVVAERIVVRFAPEGQGDSFLKFRVLISDGRKILTGHRTREYFRVGLVTQPNRAQREFAFPVRPQRPVPEGVEGEIVQLVRLEVLASDGPRGQEVGQEGYQALPEAEQGAVEYYRQTVAGRQIRVKQEIYEVLPEAEQGPVRYYRWERPRLAEVEVYTLGDNVVRVTRRPRKRGAVTAQYLFERTFSDGKHSTFQAMPQYDPVRDRNQLEIDLGAKYWLDRVRLLSPADPPPAYQIRLADGSLDPSGRKIWHTFDERQNLQAFLQLEERFAPREVRFIEVRRLNLLAGSKESGKVSEVQAYGEGYVSEVVMESPLIPLGGSRLFTDLTWEGDAPPNTRIEVRTRSGDELHLVPHYFHPNGAEIPQSAWERLEEDERPAVVIDSLPGPDWSRWGEVYRAFGDRFNSPSPRRFALVQVRLTSREPLRAASIRQLSLGFGPPLVDQVFGEIWPTRQVAAGEEQRFTLYLRPVFGHRNPGWDRLRLSSSSSARIEVLSVRAGEDESLRLGAGLQLWPGEMQVESGEEGQAELVFPRPVVGGEKVYAIGFRTSVFLSNTLFAAELRRDTQPGVVQMATAGEATSLVESQSLVVRADLQESVLLRDMKIEPRLFTPNGDGVNDEAEIRFVVSVIEGDKRLLVGIHDLAGRRVRRLTVRRTRPSGSHQIGWDGRDDHGVLVPPGSYVARIGFKPDVHLGDTSAARLVQVAY